MGSTSNLGDLQPPDPQQIADQQPSSPPNLPQPSIGGLPNMSVPATQAGGVKALLSNFFQGAGAAMMHHVGLKTPQEQVQQQFENNLATQRQQSINQANDSLEQMRQFQQDQANRYPMTSGMAQAIGKPELEGTMTTNKDYFGLLSKTAPAQIKADSAQSVQNTKLQGTHDQIAANLQRLQTTQQYQRWKTQQDNATKMAVAQLGQGKAPAAMLQSALFAQSGLNRLNDGEQAIDQLEKRGVLGSIPANKLEDWLFGKGLVDPNLNPMDRELIGRARAALSFTSSAAMRAHTGRTSKEIYDDFKGTLGMGQSLDALRGAFGETRSMLNDYATGATNASINSLRNGTPNQGKVVRWGKDASGNPVRLP